MEITCRTSLELRDPKMRVRLEQAWRACLASHGHAAMYCTPRMVCALADGLRHDAYVIEARSDDRVVGLLPLIHVRSVFFGGFLVSLPYVSFGGVIADCAQAAQQLANRAVSLAAELNVKFLELRQFEPIEHPQFVTGSTKKVQMRLTLSADPADTWNGLKSEVRTQVRKAMKAGLDVQWGALDLLEPFFDVFASNMRDLGTPVFPRRLFREIVTAAEEQAEFGVVLLKGRPIAACLAVHGPGLTEIPSAAALRAFRTTAANSLMYWCAIERAITRGQRQFDFGRSTPESATYTFKRKWGAEPIPVAWQYHIRRGDTQAMRPEDRKFQLAKRVWQHLPVSATRIIGPMIVRGIP